MASTDKKKERKKTKDKRQGTKKSNSSPLSNGCHNFQSVGHITNFINTFNIVIPSRCKLQRKHILRRDQRSVCRHD